jgi:peptidoglycan/xylan/chitin deacetylase (PgdA/CDA1 family)
VRLFRPPKGYIDLRGAVAIGAVGVRSWLWTVDSRDWVPDVTSAEIVASVAELRAGDVVLLHDAIEGPLAPSALDRSATCAALAGIVAVARERQLQLVTLG